MVSAEISAENFAKLSLPNPGRLVGVSLSEDGRSYRLFTQMGGRSPGSLNRYYLQHPDLNGHSDIVRTSINDPELVVGDPAATLYIAHREWDGYHVASNGEQTDNLGYAMSLGIPFKDAQRKYKNEGKPNGFTSRITVAINIRNSVPQAIMGRIVPKMDNPEESEYFYHTFPLFPGEGHFTTTYDGLGELGANRELKPRKMLLPGSLEDNADMIWEPFDPNTKGNLAVKDIMLDSGNYSYTFRTIHPDRQTR